MSYIGRGSEAISNVDKLDNITFSGATTYNLTKNSVAFTPSGASNILLSMDGVVQQGNFSVANNTIVFDFSPTSNNTCDWIMHFGTGVVNTPADGTVTTAKIADGAITAAKIADGTVVASDIADNAITLAKMASGTDGNIISYDASGNPVAIATGNDGQVLTSTGAGSPPAFENASSTTINNNANNKVITGSGTANTLEGETNFIYNGSRMGVGGAGASVDLGDGIHIKTADAGGGSVDANGSELVIENSTNAGITILTPNSSKGNIYFADPQSADTGVLRYDHSDNSMRFVNNGLENFRIISSGKVGIGEPSPLGKLHVRTADSGGAVEANADELVVEGSGNSGISILSGTSSVGAIHMNDSGGNERGAFKYDHGGNTMRFHANGAEKMRIQASGNVSINSTSDAQKLFVYGSHVSENGLIKVQTSNGSGTNDLIFFKDGNDHGCGEITLNASANTVSYVTSSDYRLKQNATDIADGITRLKQLKPYRFQWKSDPDNTVDGFFAHEAQEIVPESVKGTKDAMKTAENVVVNADGTVERHDVIKEDWEQGKIDSKYANNSTWEATKEVIDRQGIDQAKLVPLLTAALKEAITKIETLETENTDIKARLTALENA